MFANLYKFVKEEADGRLRQQTTDWFKYLCRKEIPPENIILVKILINDELIALSACQIDQENVLHSLTVVKEGHRNKGNGTIASRFKIRLCNEAGVKYQTWSAEDNMCSMRMLTKSGLKPIMNRQRTRKDDETYTSVLMG